MNDIGDRRGRSFSPLPVGAALTWLMGAILPVAAETRPTGMELLLSSPREVATCLCLDRELVELSNEMTARRLELEALSRRVQELEARFREAPAPIMPTEAERAELNRSSKDLDA